MRKTLLALLAIISMGFVGCVTCQKLSPLDESLYQSVINYGSTKTVTGLIEAGANVNAWQCNNSTLLIEAVETNNPEMIATLIENGADINHQTGHGRTALIVAARNNYAGAVEELLKHNPDINIKDKDGQTALTYATDQFNNYIVELLIDYAKNRPNAEVQNATVMVKERTMP